MKKMLSVLLACVLVITMTAGIALAEPNEESESIVNVEEVIDEDPAGYGPFLYNFNIGSADATIPSPTATKNFKIYATASANTVGVWVDVHVFKPYSNTYEYIRMNEVGRRPIDNATREYVDFEADFNYSNYNENGVYYFQLEVYDAEERIIHSEMKKVAIYDNAADSLIYNLYSGGLNRDPDKGGFDNYSTGFKNKSMTFSAVATGFYLGDEMNNQSLPNDEYVNRLYRGILGREPDPDGKTYWLNRLNSGESRWTVVASFINLPEVKNICDQAGVVF